MQELCAEHDVLLIADEVICGFGRLGTWFGSQRFGVEPDLVTCAKGITSGYLPLGAVIASRADPGAVLGAPGAPSFRHGYTYSGHPAACAAALANLDIIEREGLVDRVARWSRCWRMRVEPLRSAPLVSDIRAGIGLLAAIEIDAEARAAEPGLVDRIVAECRTLGVMTRGLAGHSLQLSPPFVITEDELATVASVIADALSRVSVRASV